MLISQNERSRDRAAAVYSFERSRRKKVRRKAHKCKGTAQDIEQEAGSNETILKRGKTPEKKKNKSIWKRRSSSVFCKNRMLQRAVEQTTDVLVPWLTEHLGEVPKIVFQDRIGQRNLEHSLTFRFCW